MLPSRLPIVTLINVGFYKITWFGGTRFITICVFQMLDIIYREETLLNVIKSVTRNVRSLVLTAILAVILIYLFSIIGFIMFQDDFLMEVEKIEVPKIVASKNEFHGIYYLKLSSNEIKYPKDTICSLNIYNYIATSQRSNLKSISIILCFYKRIIISYMVQIHSNMIC